MQANSTDFIAKLAWQHTKNHWKTFILSPILGILALGLLAALFTWLSQWIGVVGGALAFVSSLSIWVFLFVYGGAASKWCEDLYKGASTLDLQGGYRYGLSRFWGTLWTSIVMMVKIFLWTLLLVIPGYYKMIQYKQSISIARLEKISGNKATQLSQKLVMGAGWLRTLGNMLSFGLLWTLAFYLSFIPVILVGGAFSFAHEIAGLLTGGVIATFLFTGCFTMLANFNTFEFLVYRDENSKAFNEAKAALNKL